MSVKREEPKDRLGREIKVGDYVVHAASYGSSATMNFGQVIDLPMKTRDSLVSRAEYGPNGLTKPAVYELVEFFKAKIQPCNDDGTPVEETKYERDASGDYKHINTGKPVRAVTVEHLNRLAVMTLD